MFANCGRARYNGARMCKVMACACAKQWLAHVQSNGVRMAMVVFTCKYKCTIKGSELDVVLELHGHGLSWQTESSFVEHEARSTEQSLCLSAGGQNAEVFPCQPPQAWKLWPPWPQLIQRILPLVQSFLRKVLSLTSLLITFRSFHRRPKAVAKGRRLSSTLEFVLLMKPKDSLFQLGNLDWIAAVRFQQLLQGSHQRKDNWGGDEDVQLLQELYHHLYLSYVFLHDQEMGQLLISPILDLAECNIYGVDVVESFSGPKKGVEWLWFFASTRVLIFTAERVPISGLTIIWRLSC